MLFVSPVHEDSGANEHLLLVLLVLLAYPESRSK